MKKIFFAGVISLILLGGFVYSTREIKNEIPRKPIPKLLSAAEMKAKLKNGKRLLMAFSTINGKPLQQVKKCMPV